MYTPSAFSSISSLFRRQKQLQRLFTYTWWFIKISGNMPYLSLKSGCEAINWQQFHVSVL